MWIYYNLVEQDYGHQKRKRAGEPESRCDVLWTHQRFSLPVPDKENRCDMYTMSDYKKIII